MVPLHEHLASPKRGYPVMVHTVYGDTAPIGITLVAPTKPALVTVVTLDGMNTYPQDVVVGVSDARNLLDPDERIELADFALWAMEAGVL